MENKLLTFYLASLAMFVLSGLFTTDYSPSKNVQYLDFTKIEKQIEQTTNISPKKENDNNR